MLRVIPESAMTDAPMPLSPAPGARGAKLCGIWSLIASATCVGIPIGLVLAIIALVQQAKAKRLAKENPDFYEQPTATGLVTGIIGLAMPVIMLPFLGIVSAIAIPALLSQRSRARDKAAIENMVGRTGDLVGQWDKQRELGANFNEALPRLENYIQETSGHDRDPWNSSLPAYNYRIEVVEGFDTAEGMKSAAYSRATQLGQVVFIIQNPQNDKPGFIVGVVQTQEIGLEGNHCMAWVSQIE